MPHRMHRMLISVSLLLLSVAAACGSAPTQQEAAEPDPAAPVETEAATATEPGAAEAGGESTEASSAEPGSFEAVYAEVEELDPEARQERLIELAEECGGSVNVYSTMNGEEGPESMALFEQQTGINAEFYRASSTDVLNRVLQEHEAGYENPADVITTGYELVILEREGMLAPLNTVAADQLPEGGVTDHYAWIYLNVFTPMWNTNAISPEEAPQTWTDVLTDYPGEVVFETTDWDWFYRVVPVLMEENDISEDEAIAMVRDAMRNAAAMVRGHTTMAQFVAAGQYDISGTSYHSNAVDLKAEGAPVEWEPPIDPLIVLPFVAGLNAEAPCPAGAVLFMDFFLTEAQAIMAKHGRQPANLSTEGGSLPPDYNVVAVDLQKLVDEQERWEGLYNEFVQQSGLPVQE